MRRAKEVVLFFSLVCSVISTETSNEPSLRVIAKSFVYNINENRAIYCEKKNTEEPLAWISPSGDEVKGVSTKNHRVYVEKKRTEPDMLALIIHSAKLEDSGNWTCKLGDLSETIEIVVGQKVVMALKSENIIADEGKNVKLQCEAKGIPVPAVQWYKNSVLIDEDPYKYVTKKQKNDVYTLEIKNLSYMDSGEYMCKVMQKALSYYTDKIITLTVHHKPFIFNPDTGEEFQPDPVKKIRLIEVFAVLNYTKNITCNAIGVPTPTFRWFRRHNNYDRPILEEDMIFSSENGVNSTLLLRMLDETDSGEYKCLASNNKGQVDIIFDVTPGQKPAPPDTINLVEANITHLLFNVSCYDCTIKGKGYYTAMNPDSLPVDGYSFHLIPHNDEYPPDWDQAAYAFTVDILDVNDTTFAVGPLPNNTIYDARVRARNAAGFSDWLVMVETAATTNHAIRLASTFIVFTASVMGLFY